MKTRYLIPNRYKKVGFILLIVAIIFWIFQVYITNNYFKLTLPVLSIIYSPLGGSEGTKYFEFPDQDIVNTTIAVVAIIGALIIMLSVEKFEDEYIGKIRLESLLWATIFNNFIIVFCLLTIWDMGFLVVMSYNLVTTLILFIIKFHYSLYRMRKEARNEK